jgi:hypothetical protein
MNRLRIVLAATALVLARATPCSATETDGAVRSNVEVHAGARPEASDCPGSEPLSMALAGALPGGVSAPLRHPIDLSVDFTRTDAGFVATVKERTEGWTRTIQGSAGSCAALTDAAILAMALMVDDLRAPAAPAAPPAPPVPPSTLWPAPAAEQPEAAPRPPARVSVEAGGGVAIGALTDAAPFVSLAALWNITRIWSIGLEGWTLAAESIAYPPGSVDLWVAAGSVVGCGALGSLGSLRFSACLQPALGALHGAGEGYSTNGSANKLWAALGAAARVSGALSGSFEWTARVEPFALIDRQEFSVTGLGVGYSPAPAGVMAGIGVRTTIW